MKIELRKLEVYPRMSEETTAFNAYVYLDGVLLGEAGNDGHGGMTNIQVRPEQRERLAQAEEWAKALPKLKFDNKNGPSDELPMSLDFYIDMLVQVHETWKVNKNNGFTTWRIAQQRIHDASGIEYPEFRLWKQNEKIMVYYPSQIV